MALIDFVHKPRFLIQMVKTFQAAQLQHERFLTIDRSTPFENAQRWMGKNTFHFLLLNDDNMIGEH